MCLFIYFSSNICFSMTVFFLWSWRTFRSESVFLLVYYPPLPVWLVVLSAEHKVASTGNKNFSSGSLELLFLLPDSWNYDSWEKYPQMVAVDSDHIKYLDNMAQALQCIITQLAGMNDLSKDHFTILSNLLLWYGVEHCKTGEFNEQELIR